MATPNRNQGTHRHPVPDMPLPRSVLQSRAPDESLELSTPRRPTDPSSIDRWPGVASMDKKRPVESSRPTEWRVNDKIIRSLPRNFPLEQTHVFIEGNVSASVVGSRIVECLREESISALYNDDNATVLAETSDFTTFHIRLFKDHRGVLLVEIQRRDGCAIDFHNAARKVLRAAQGLTPETEIRYTVMPLPVEDDDQQNWQDGIDNALELARSLLTKDRLDANVLGMESLKFLTDATSSTQETACYVARNLFSGEGDLLDTIVSLIVCWRLHDCDDDVGPRVGGTEENRYHALMHSHALSVLANAMLALGEDGSDQEVLSSADWLKDGEVLPALLKDVASAHCRPHDSLQAARCLNIVCRSSDELKSKAIELGAREAASASFDEGYCRHAMLAREAEVMIRTIKSST